MQYAPQLGSEKLTAADYQVNELQILRPVDPDTAFHNIIGRAIVNGPHLPFDTEFEIIQMPAKYDLVLKVYPKCQKLGRFERSYEFMSNDLRSMLETMILSEFNKQVSVHSKKMKKS